MCYVNAAMIALSWLTLLCQSLVPLRWVRGYELMRGLCQWNPIPLNLRVFQPLRWLLFGAFSEADLLSQQDILEFMTFIIDRLQPNFCLAAGALDFNTLHMCHIRCLTVKKATDLHQYSCGSSIIWTPIAASQSSFTTGMTPQVFVAQVTRQEIASF